ncbi:MAG: PAS domain-containing protein [bacterium]|nr:PAS domain-containing protein [bacterium]
MAQLSLLYKFGRELSSASNWDKTLESMLENLAGFVEAKGAALVLRPSPESPFSPRKTFQWDEPNLQKMLDRLESEREKLSGDKVASHGIFLVKPDGEDSPPVSALPLDHKSICLGYLLLLGFGDSEHESKYLPLLNAIQIILAEEVASAQMLDRIRELSTFNSQVLETVNSGIWVLDQNGMTIYCNRQGRELISGKTEVAEDYSMPKFGIGRGRAETIPNSAASFLRDSAFTRANQSELFVDKLLSIDSSAIDLDKLLNSPAVFTGEGTIQQPGGQRVPVLVQSSPMQGQNSKQHWLVVVLDDLRVTKRMEAEKVRADNLESLVEMSATLAHEIRNPLMGLSAQAELLLENLDPGDDKVRYLDVITGEVTRINDTISRMLNYTRPYEPELDETDLIKLVEDCVVLSAPRCQSENVSITTKFNIDVNRKYAVDGSQLKQVVMNILFNAIDASPENGVVALEISDTDQLEQIDISSGISTLADGVEISITDSGKGFSVNDSGKLFRPFFTTKTTGTGLGLSMSKKIIEAHKGNISAECSKGCTVFKFCIPA